MYRDYYTNSNHQHMSSSSQAERYISYISMNNSYKLSVRDMSPMDTFEHILLWCSTFLMVNNKYDRCNHPIRQEFSCMICTMLHFYRKNSPSDMHHMLVMYCSYNIHLDRWSHMILLYSGQSILLCTQTLSRIFYLDQHKLLLGKQGNSISIFLNINNDLQYK